MTPKNDDMILWLRSYGNMRKKHEKSHETVLKMIQDKQDGKDVKMAEIVQNCIDSMNDLNESLKIYQSIISVLDKTENTKYKYILHRKYISLVTFTAIAAEFNVTRRLIYYKDLYDEVRKAWIDGNKANDL